MDTVNYILQCKESERTFAKMIEEQIAKLNSQGYDVCKVDGEIIATKRM